MTDTTADVDVSDGLVCLTVTRDAVEAVIRLMPDEASRIGVALIEAAVSGPGVCLLSGGRVLTLGVVAPDPLVTLLAWCEQNAPSRRGSGWSPTGHAVAYGPPGTLRIGAGTTCGCGARVIGPAVVDPDTPHS